MLRYLFVCGQGEKRSPTAAAVARELADERGIELMVTSGGVDIRLTLPRKEMAKHFKQYDLVFTMEQYMVEKLENKCGVNKSKIVLLNVSDDYERHDPVLRSIFRKKLDYYVLKE